MGGDADHKQLMDAINTLNNKMDTRFTQMEERVISEVQKLRLEITGISAEQAKQGEAITEVQIQVEILKQKALNCDLVILGIPNLKAGDNLVNVVNRVFTVAGCNQIRAETDIKSIFLMKSGNSKSIYTPICVQLNSATYKSAILSLQKKNGPVPVQKIDNTVLGSDTNKIVFKHRLTPFNSSLLKESHKFKNQFKYSYCWFQDTVLLKQSETSKPLRICCMRDLEELAAKERNKATSSGLSSSSVG